MFPAGQSYDETVDIFSFGIVLCEVRPQCYMASLMGFFPPAISLHRLLLASSECALCDLTAQGISLGVQAYLASVPSRKRTVL